MRAQKVNFPGTRLPKEIATVRRRRGHLNGVQMQILSIHMSTIQTILTREPGLNISQIAARFSKTRAEMATAWPLSPELRGKLPTSENPDNLRKTVRKHLIQMLSFGKVKLVNGKYYPIERKESDLVGFVEHVYDEIKPQNWSYPAAEDCAICRTYVDPQFQYYDFDSFFGDHLSDFQHSIFYLDRILVDAIGRGSLSPKFYDPVTSKLSPSILKNGLTTHFKDTRLLVWTFAISPKRLLTFLEGNIGRGLLTDMLRKDGEEVLARGKRRLAERRAMERKRRKVEKEGELMRLRHNAEIQNRPDAAKVTND
jgi:hypothetical protein